LIYRLSEIDVPAALAPRIPPWVSQCGVAVLLLAMIVAARLGIDIVAPGTAPFALCFPALLIATILAGWQAGAITATLGGILAWYGVLNHRASFGIEGPADIVNLVLYAVAAALMVAVTHAFCTSAKIVVGERNALHESEERFRLVAENAPVNLWMGDLEGRCVYLNRAQREFWGVGADLSQFSWNDTLLPEDAAGLWAVFSTAMQRREPFRVEARYRRADGAIRTLATEAQPRFDGSGAFLGMIGVNVDVTEARLAEKRQRLLVNELNHRVKNTLATVQSLAYQTTRGKTAMALVDDFLARLMALSAAHDVLTRESWEAADLQDIVQQAIRPYELPQRQRFVVDGCAVRVSPRASLAISMALHELATNAVKYGALSTDTGEVAIRWKIVNDELAQLEWAESGGPPVVEPSRHGFGSRLLQRGLVGDLGASPTLTYAPEGVTCAFKIMTSKEEGLVGLEA
jgi:PAS domain S-box-containing protein